MHPEPTHYARHESSQRIPAARVPTLPSEIELEQCEARLRDTEIGHRVTLRVRGAK